MKKLLVVLVGMILLSACSFDKQAVEGISIVHSSGETKVEVNPENVVIFDMGILDIFLSLDIPVSGLPKANLSERLNHYASDDYFNAGTLFEPDFETIAKNSPDLIIISGRALSNYEELSKIAPTITLDLDNENYLKSVYRNLDVIKTLYPAKAEQIELEKTNMDLSIKELKEAASTLNEKTLFLLANGDSISVYGPKSRYGMIYDDFGFTALDNVEYTDSRHGQQISFEFISEHNPDSIVVLDRTKATESSEVLGEDLLDNDLIKNTKASLNSRIIYLDPHAWYIETGGLTATKLMIADIKNLVE